MENASAKLSPRELFQLKWMLGGLLSLLSMWSVWMLGIGAEMLVGCALFAVSVALVFPRLPGHIPSVVWKVSPIVLLLFILGDFVLAGADFVPPLIRAILLLLTFRALEYRRRRHDLQLVALGLFIVVTSGVLSMDLSFALQVILFTPVAMLVLFTITLSETVSRDAVEVPDNPWQGFRWWLFGRRLFAVFDRRLMLFSGGLFAAMAVSAALMFVLLPRFELGQALPFLRMKAQQSLSGFSETVEFGDIVDIIRDDRVALRADVAGERPSEAPYWRMLPLDSYDGRRFQVSESAQEANRRFSDFRFELDQRGPAADSAGQWTVYFESGVARFLPFPGQFTRIRFQSRQDLVYNPTFHLLSLREVPGAVLFYQIDELVQGDRVPATRADQALVDRGPNGAGEAESGRYPATTLAVPADAPTRTILDQALAAITRGEALSVQEFSDRATAWLHERHGYSLTSSIPAGEGDPLARWMAWGEGGHCELFAGSMVLLARAAGYPARLVTGFHGGDWNGYENYFMVRNAHAHAWVEVFDGRGHWLRVDPTPGSGRPGEAALSDAAGGSDGEWSEDRTFEAYLDSLWVLWYRRVVNFDRDQQRALMADVRGQLREALRTVRDSLSAAQRQMRALFAGGWRWRDVLAAAPRILSGILLIGLSLLLWRVLHRQWVRGPSAGNRVRRRAGRWLRRMQPTTIAGEPAALSVHADLLVLRYGPQDSWPPPRNVFRLAARTIRQSRRRNH